MTVKNASKHHIFQLKQIETSTSIIILLNNYIKPAPQERGEANNSWTKHP